MAEIKVNHFAAKTISVGNTVDWECIVREFFIAFLLGVFAYMGYTAQIALLLFTCALGSFACLLSSFHTVYMAIVDWRHAKKAGVQTKT
jgi:4-hydroxybenzoate polyprenyltransferase